jgi:hypothetical protein
MNRALVTGLFVTACFGLALGSLSGCDDKKGGPKLAPSASALASSVLPPSAKATRFTIAPTSETSLTLEAPDLLEVTRHVRLDRRVQRAELRAVPLVLDLEVDPGLVLGASWRPAPTALRCGDRKQAAAYHRARDAALRAGRIRV